MTAQEPEILIYNGERYYMASEPLNYYFAKSSKKYNLVSPSTACWRGYFGTWEINDNKLYLIDLKAYVKGYKEVGIKYFFRWKKKVFAEWYSGTIKVNIGEILQYVHMGYESVYEKELLLKFENGILIEKSFVENSID